MSKGIESEILPDRLTIEHAHIVESNFSGVASQFNPPGARNFLLGLTDEKAQELIASDIPWRVRLWTEKEDVPGLFVLPVHLRGGTFEDLSASVLSGHTLELSGLAWKFEDKSGIKAYLESYHI